MTGSADQYAGYVSGEHREPSRIAVILPGWQGAPDPTDVVATLARRGLDAAVIRAGADEARADDGETTLWEVAGDFGRLVCRETDVDPAYLQRFASDLSASERDATQSAYLAIEHTTELGDALLESYREQLRVLHDIAPDALAVHDRSSFQWRARSWWLDVLATRTPPAPACLFGVHAVRDGDVAWLHTHGLDRCGIVELELLAVPTDAARDVAALLHHAALYLLDMGCTEPGEAFTVGRDLEICWQPWELATAQLPAGALGGRDDRDPDHSGARGILSLPGETWRSAAELAPALADEPLFWVSSSETERMAMLAIERFPMFRELVQRFAADEDWDFLAKIGYRVDADDDEAEAEAGDPDEADRPSEHMWFRVHAIDGTQIDATLLNQPYQIARMRAGDRGRHAADQLSDWSVGSPFGSVGPDRVGLVFERLRDAADG